MLFDKLIEQIHVNSGIKQPQVEDYRGDLISTQVPITSEFADDDQSYLNRTYKETWIVYRCVFLIANNIAKLPKRVYQLNAKGHKLDISDRPEFRIFKEPNIFQTPYDFWMESISRLKMQGELFWLKQFDARNRIEALYADWRSEQVEIVPDPQKLIKEYKVKINQRDEIFPPDQVFYVHYFDPFSNLRGCSPIKAARHEITLDLNAVNFNKKFFSQGMKVAGVLESPNKLEKGEANRLQNEWQQMYSGGKNVYKTAVLWGGLTFKPLNDVKLRDAEFIESRRMSKDNVAGVFGVPLELLTFDNKTYENVKEAQKTFWQFTLMPDIKKIDDLVNTFLMPQLTDRRDSFFEHDISGVEALQESRSEKLEDYDKAFKIGGATPNDIITEVFGGEPVDTPEMNSYYLPLNITPVGQANSKKMLLLPKQFQKQATKEDRDKIWEYKAAQTAAQEKTFIYHLKRFFGKQEKEVLSNFDNQYKSKKQLEVQGELFNLDKWIEEARKFGEPLIIEAVREAGVEIMGAEFDLTHPAVRNSLGMRVAKYSVDINQTTRDKIRKAIQEGFAIGIIMPTIRQRIVKIFKKAKGRRSDLIARTEIIGSTNFGSQQGMVQGGFQRKMWITSRDAAVRDSHHIDGQVRNVNESFTLLDGRTMEYPMDFNERCFQVPTQEARTS